MSANWDAWLVIIFWAVITVIALRAVESARKRRR